MLRRPQPLVPAEEEEALPDGAAERPAELILLERRQLVGVGELRRVELAVAHVLVDRSARLERPRLGDDVDLAGAGAAELRGVGAGLDLEFTNRVGRQADHERVERWIRVDRAVEEVHVGIRPAAADRDRGVLARPPVQRIHVAHLRAVRGVRAGHQQRELEKLPAVERQLGDLTLIDYFANRRVAHVQQRHGLRHLHLLRQAACLQHDVRADALVDFDMDRELLAREA